MDDPVPNSIFHLVTSSGSNHTDIRQLSQVSSFLSTLCNETEIVELHLQVSGLVLQFCTWDILGP